MHVSLSRLSPVVLLLLGASSPLAAQRAGGTPATRKPAAAASAASAASAADVPVVTVGYSFLLDGACAMQTRRPLDSAFVAEVQGRVGRYKALWAERGPGLMRAAREVTGQPFHFHETTAAIVTCGLPSMSFPLVLNAQSFRRAAGDTTVKNGEESLFVTTLLHEVLHRYVDDRLRELPGYTTPLLTKYAAESPFVRSHLHLYAIQRIVYDRLGLGAELTLSESVDSQLRNAAAFARAHEIVAAEGTTAFVRELGSGTARPAAGN